MHFLTPLGFFLAGLAIPILLLYMLKLRRKQGIRYLDVTTRQPWDQVLLLEMRRAGIVK